MICSWAARPECGADWTARFMLRLVLGWAGAARALLWPIALYYVLTAGTARRASRQYLARVLNRKVRLTDLLRHFHQFAAVILDRALLLSGRNPFQVEIDGLDLVIAQMERGGAILLGAHLGSFEILRSVAAQAPMRVRPFMFRKNQGPAAKLLESLSPKLRSDVIEIGAPDAMLRVQDALQRGEWVGMLADRAPRAERFVSVPFLGADAPFPAGPLLAAAVLDAPVLLFYGVRTGPGRYRVGFEPFADHIKLPRSERMPALQNWVARYAARLETLCRAHPFNWFNFYDFWNPHVETASAVPAPARAASAAGTAPIACG